MSTNSVTNTIKNYPCPDGTINWNNTNVQSCVNWGNQAEVSQCPPSSSDVHRPVLDVHNPLSLSTDQRTNSDIVVPVNPVGFKPGSKITITNGDGDVG